jgi:hypothetical protein
VVKALNYVWGALGAPQNPRSSPAYAASVLLDTSLAAAGRSGEGGILTELLPP